MIVDKIENYKKYFNKESWKKSFEFIMGLDENSEEKRYELGDGVFAIVMSYHTKDVQDANLESHKKYIDIQASIKGAEGIEWYPIDANLELKEEYSEKADVMFYHHPGVQRALIANIPGYFTVLWPEDIHMPQLKILDLNFVKKVVVKIPVAIS
ncbi:YhcH/YjgK/YiaL family protein [Bacteriovoracaceae bacterium]|nr:YhcH/YjgK/YiaL family protein [Bacteriovoracaceae bacterium]